MIKQKYKIFLTCLLLGLVVANFASAAIVNCGGRGQTQCRIQDIIFLIERIINFLLAWAWLVSIFYILWASFQMITSGGNQESIAKGKETLKNAIIGFFLIMAAYLIISLVVNIVTGQGSSGTDSYNIFRSLIPQPRPN